MQDTGITRTISQGFTAVRLRLPRRSSPTIHAVLGLALIRGTVTAERLADRHDVNPESVLTLLRCAGQAGLLVGLSDDRRSLTPHRVRYVLTERGRRNCLKRLRWQSTRLGVAVDAVLYRVEQLGYTAVDLWRLATRWSFEEIGRSAG